MRRPRVGDGIGSALRDIFEGEERSIPNDMRAMLRTLDRQGLNGNS